MKTSILIISTAVIALSMSSFTPDNVTFGNAQQESISKQTTGFAFFRTHRQGKGVTATWGMTSADQIVDFTIQRTYEDASDPYAYWEDLAVVPNNNKRSFTYTDEEVFPGAITYRIVALLNDGRVVTSEISTVRIRSRH